MLSCHLLVLLCIMLPSAWSGCVPFEGIRKPKIHVEDNSACVCFNYSNKNMMAAALEHVKVIEIGANSTVNLTETPVKSKVVIVARGCKLFVSLSNAGGEALSVGRNSNMTVSVSELFVKANVTTKAGTSVIISGRSKVGTEKNRTIVSIDVGASALLTVTGSSTVNANGHIVVDKSSKFKVEGESKIVVGLVTRYTDNGATPKPTTKSYPDSGATKPPKLTTTSPVTSERMSEKPVPSSPGNITIGVKSALVTDGSKIEVAGSLIIGDGGSVSAHGSNITADGSIQSNGSIYLLSAQLFSNHVNTGAASKLDITDSNIWAKSINISTGSKLKIAKSILINKTFTAKETNGELSTGQNSELILASQSQQVCVVLEKIQLSEDSLLHMKISADHCGNVVNVLVEKNTECHIKGEIQKGDLSGPNNSMRKLDWSIVTDRVKCKVRFATTAPTTTLKSRDSHPTTTPSNVPAILMWTGIAVAILVVLIGLVAAGVYFYRLKKNDETTRGTAAATRVKNKNLGQN